MKFLSTKNIRPDMILATEIFELGRKEQMLPGTILKPLHMDFFRQRGYIGAYIEDSFSDEVIVHENISNEVFTTACEAVRNEDGISIFMIADVIINDIKKSGHLIVDTIDIRSHDDYRVRHSVNVALISTIMAMKMGLSSEDVKSTCIAGLCHDLGYKMISNTILNKQGELTRAEFARIRLHPAYSYDIIKGSLKVNDVVKEAIIHHHENENGSGYPAGNEGSELTMVTKILHVADTFDGLVSIKPYKDARAFNEALEYLKGGRGILYNEEAVDALCDIVPYWYPGTDVKLSNGETALVIKAFEDQQPPKVKLYSTGRTLDLNDPQNRDIYIESSDYLQDKDGEEVEEDIDNINGYQGKHTIMLVDDTLMSLLQTQKTLGTKYEYVLCKSGFEGISYFSKNPAPDLMIVDIAMPMLDGISMVRSLRRKGYVDVPVIFLTGTCDKNTVLACKDVGAIDYIVKPARPVYIQERVAQAFKNIN